jgi:hypothetical protein
MFKNQSQKLDLIITGNNNETYCQGHYPGIYIKSIFCLINKYINEV